MACTGWPTWSSDDDGPAGKGRVRRLPVIDRHRLVGILGQADLAKALPDEKAGDLVQAISQD